MTTTSSPCHKGRGSWSAGQAQAWKGKQPGTETRELWTSHKASQKRCFWNAALVLCARQRRHFLDIVVSGARGTRRRCASRGTSASMKSSLLGSTVLASWSISTEETWLTGSDRPLGTRPRARAATVATQRDNGHSGSREIQASVCCSLGRRGGKRLQAAQERAEAQ